MDVAHIAFDLPCLMLTSYCLICIVLKHYRFNITSLCKSQIKLSPISMPLFQMVSVRVVQVLSLMWHWLETKAGVLSTAGWQRCCEDSGNSCLWQDEPASRHRAVHSQWLPNLGNQSMGKGTFKQWIEYACMLYMTDNMLLCVICILVFGEVFWPCHLCTEKVCYLPICQWLLVQRLWTQRQVCTYNTLKILLLFFRSLFSQMWLLNESLYN